MRKPTKIEIATTLGIREVYGHKFGSWNAQPSWNGWGWTVSDAQSGRHLPTWMVNDLTEDEACLVARHLDRTIGPRSDSQIGRYGIEALIAEALDPEVRR